MPLLPQPYGRTTLGQDPILFGLIGNGGTLTFAMAALNTGYTARFVWTGPTGHDIKSVKLNWSTVTTPGTVTLRIETIDLTTGKPTGTLYDANAVITGIVPAVGWQTYTFATTPTTNLTQGGAYAIVLLTTVAGTTQTLRHAINQAAYPSRPLTATDGTTRSNFAEVVGLPVLSVVLDDNTEDTLGCFPYGVQTGRQLTGTLGVGQRYSITDDLKVAGVLLEPFNRVGTVTGDLRVRIFDASGTVQASVTVDKDLLITNASRAYFWFNAVVTLTAAGGPYVILCDQSDHGGTSNNAFQINTATASSSALIASSKNVVTTTDATAVPPTFTDVLTDVAPLGLILADGVVPSAAPNIEIAVNTALIMQGYQPVAY